MDIKGFVFSVIIVLVLVVGSASFLFVPMDDSSLVMDAKASPLGQTNDIEEIWLDSYSIIGYPTCYSQDPLTKNRPYKITVEGTWSNWPTGHWLDEDDPPVGPIEGAPMYPGQGGGEKTGTVGLDAFWMFACIWGDDYARDNGWWPLPAKIGFLTSLDDGTSWIPLHPIDNTYNPAHEYESIVVGKDDRIGFKLPDSGANDNYGMFNIIIEGDKDSDGDGLWDLWEKNGIDIDSDGTTDLDLKALDTDWQHKDIFVEIDYMDGFRPDDVAIDNVKIAFSKAPVNNPDSRTGIDLRVLMDQKIDYQSFTLEWGDIDYFKSTFFGTLADQSSDDKTTILEAKKQVYHYCLFVNELAEIQGSTVQKTGYSGVGETPGNDFVVALGNLHQWPKVQAGVFMHELGHNLGLNHGGKDEVNYKPNYLSVMNYMFMLESIIYNRPLDYSRIELPTLDESDLNELDGVGVDYVPAYNGGWSFTGYMDPSQNITVPSILRPIDWDGDHYYNISARANVNDCSDIDIGYTSPPDELLFGNNDWENIILPFQNLPSFADKVHGQILEEDMTTDTIEKMMEAALNYHEVTLVNATPSSTLVYTDSVLDVVVRSANPGANNETANLQVYAGTALIAQRDVFLERGNITSTTLRCDISAVPKGDQVITIRLEQVPGEEDAFDNDFTYGAIEFIGEATPPPSDQSWPLILGVSVAVVAVIAIALFIVLRKRGKKDV